MLIKILNYLRTAFRLESAISLAISGEYTKAIAVAEDCIRQDGRFFIEATLIQGRCYWMLEEYEPSREKFLAVHRKITTTRKLSDDDKDYLLEYIRQHFETDKPPYFNQIDRLRRVKSRFRKSFPLNQDLWSTAETGA